MGKIGWKVRYNKRRVKKMANSQLTYNDSFIEETSFTE